MHFSVLFEFSQAICHFLTALLKYNLHTIKSTHLKQYVIFTKAMTPLKIMGRSEQKKIGFICACLPVLLLWWKSGACGGPLEDFFG